MSWKQWSARIQKHTERFLTWRKRRKIVKKEKQKRKNPILDWMEAILSAVVIVLLINQFLVQAYQIPSQSMVSTLMIGDRIFVNKLVYGPELLPGMLKLPGVKRPRRGDVIIFENPSYIPIGPVLDTLQRVIYMLTLSLVDIDRDEYGNPKHHFLIKRAVGVAGDRIRLHQGEVEFLLPGNGDWLTEQDLQEQLQLPYPIRRMFDPGEYRFFKQTAIGLALLDSGLPVQAQQEQAMERYFRVNSTAGGGISWSQKALVDNAYLDQWRYRTLYAIKPFSQSLKLQWQILDQGWYVPQGRIFPMGDNRDDSRDARYFGPVRLQKVLGKAMFKYWPLPRFGVIR